MSICYFVNSETLNSLTSINRTYFEKTKNLSKYSRKEILNFFNKINFDIDSISTCEKIEDPILKIIKLREIINKMSIYSDPVDMTYRWVNIYKNLEYENYDVDIIAKLIYENREICNIWPEIKTIIKEFDDYLESYINFCDEFEVVEEPNDFDFLEGVNVNCNDDRICDLVVRMCCFVEFDF